MPKSRYEHMDRKGVNSFSVDAFQSNLTRSDLLLSAPPRKVSFEENRNDSYASICSDDDTVPTNKNKITEAEETNEQEQQGRSIGKKRSLVRPVTSLSLVDLAKSVAQDGASPVTCEQNSGDEIEGRHSKRVRSFNLSPRSIVNLPHLTDMDLSSSVQPHAEGESKSRIRTSPWGHFIDMTPEDDYFDLPRTPYANYNCTSKTTKRGAAYRSSKDSLCRSRRRLSPYGEYKSYEVRVEHPTLHFAGLRTDIRSMRKFRLSPRKINMTYRSADELIGVFSDLQVRHDVDQKTIL